MEWSPTRAAPMSLTSTTSLIKVKCSHSVRHFDRPILIIGSLNIILTVWGSWTTWMTSWLSSSEGRLPVWSARKGYTRSGIVVVLCAIIFDLVPATWRLRLTAIIFTAIVRWVACLYWKVRETNWRREQSRSIMVCPIEDERWWGRWIV